MHLKNTGVRFPLLRLLKSIWLDDSIPLPVEGVLKLWDFDIIQQEVDPGDEMPNATQTKCANLKWMILRGLFLGLQQCFHPKEIHD